MGTVASILATSGIKPDAHITIGVITMGTMSIDTAPLGLGLPPDSSPAGRARNAALNIGQRERLQGLQELFIEQLSSLGAQNPGFFIDAGTGLSDRYIQMCIPELEYPRSDLPPNVRFAGGLPRGSRDPSTTFPPFWDEITRISQTKEKKIVAGSQGTFATLPTQLLLPKPYLHWDKDQTSSSSRSSVPAMPRCLRTSQFPVMYGLLILSPATTYCCIVICS